jgi:hypothetical protein
MKMYEKEINKKIYQIKIFIFLKLKYKNFEKLRKKYK